MKSGHLTAEDIEFAAINRWLSVLGIRTITEWDILLFLHRHGASLLDFEQIASLTGYSVEKIIAALWSLQQAGLVRQLRDRGMGAYTCALFPQEYDKLHAFTHLMHVADSRDVRVAIMGYLNPRPRWSDKRRRHNLRAVALGGSAGALGALEEIVEHLPPNTGMAFIVIQHLHPQGQSLLPGILSRKTPMPVWQIEDCMRIEADRIFVIPSNTTLTIQDEVLHLCPRTVDRFGRHRSIDVFFTSLAKDLTSDAISVILSGMNDDGVVGTASIKKAGGMTMAQQLDSASQTEMPREAIADGWVDFVETPRGIAQRLGRLSQADALSRSAV